MGCILMPECNFSHGYFRCLSPVETVDMEVKIKTMKGMFWRDHTTQVISCKPWSPKQHPYPLLAKKMKTYLELKGQNVDHPSFNAVKLPLCSPCKTLVPRKSQDKKKRRSKMPLRRQFKIRLVEKPSSPSNAQVKKPTTTATATKTTTAKPSMSTAKWLADQPNSIPLTIYKAPVQQCKNSPV